MEAQGRHKSRPGERVAGLPSLKPDVQLGGSGESWRKAVGTLGASSTSGLAADPHCSKARQCLVIARAGCHPSLAPPGSGIS